MACGTDCACEKRKMQRGEGPLDQKGVYSSDFPCNFKGAGDPGSELPEAPAGCRARPDVGDPARLASSPLLPSLPYSHAFLRIHRYFSSLHLPARVKFSFHGTCTLLGHQLSTCIGVDSLHGSLALVFQSIMPCVCCTHRHSSFIHSTHVF